MNRILRVSLAGAIAVFLCSAQNPAGSAPRTGNGYLSSSEMPDVVRIVPPAPKDGDPRFKNDMAIFHATRALQGSARWALAQSDDNMSTAGLLQAFSCAIGVQLSAEKAPKLTALIAKATADAAAAAGVLKDFYKHKRPFQVEDAVVCLTPQRKSELERVPDYPSGHTTAGWETGLILAELAPDRSTAVLARARAFGQSRIVCGVHNESAVEAGWMTASSVFAAQNGNREFRADMEAAKAELKTLRAAPSQMGGRCTRETQALANNPY